MSVVDLTTGASYPTLSEAISGSSANDVIQISAGSYVENFPDITHNLTIESADGMAYLSNPQPDPPNGRAVINVPGNLNVSLTLIGLDISGAVDDASNPPSGGGANGAGILFESGNGALVVENSHIHNNEDGILSGGANSFSLSGMTVTIANTEIDHNGVDPSNLRYGFDHNLYIGGPLTQLTVTNSYIHDALGGNEIKSDAATTTITDSRIQDGPTAAASYSIDLPAGGVATIENNVIEKGVSSPNDAFIHYGGDVPTVAPDSSLTISGNTVIDNRASGQGPFVFDGAVFTNGGPIVAPTINGNAFYGPGPNNLLAGPGFFDVQSGTPYAFINSFLPITNAPALDTSPPFTLQLQEPSAEYEIAVISEVNAIVKNTATNLVQTAANAEQITFSDGVGVVDTTGNAEEAARLYQAALGRGPDVAGLDYWAAQLDSHTLDLDGVAMGFINSTEFNDKYGTLDNADFVTQLYQNVLHRPPDSAGEQDWTNQLNGGVSRAQVLIGFSDSLENKLDTQGTIGDPNMDEAYRLYQAALDRTPDTPGLGVWTGQLDGGISLLQVAQGFVSSNEFAQLFAGLDTKGFVDQLYQNVLHRAPDSAGEQDWINQLNGGVSKAQVLLGFSDSLENRLNTSQATHDGWVFIRSA